MLVLTRKKKQALILGENIKITVVAVEGDKVKLGIEAPSDLKIYREEIFEAIKQENAAAVQLNKEMLGDLDLLRFFKQGKK
ncbi:carbon storage regulator CsrA [Bacillota bacterium LX-D]|nr:carbon storage regulator CsrA [Bacillota bacterium LX-D]